VRALRAGPPREANAAALSHCGADFTLHDRDLNTVAPAAFAALAIERLFVITAGWLCWPSHQSQIESSLACPVCPPTHHLVSRRLGEVSAMEAGAVRVSVGAHNVSVLTMQAGKQAERTIADVSLRVRGPPMRKRRLPPSGAIDLADLSRSDVRRNFGRLSGVIIDVCRNHGVWFDDDELSRILDWTRRGGLRWPVRNTPGTETRSRRKAAHAARRRRAVSDDTEPGESLFGTMVESLWNLFD